MQIRILWFVAGVLLVGVAVGGCIPIPPGDEDAAVIGDSAAVQDAAATTDQASPDAARVDAAAGNQDKAPADLPPPDMALADLPPMDIPLCPFTDACLYLCGNGTITSPWEQCDGSNLGGQTCRSLGYAEGTLKCTSRCKFDTWWCIPIGCGNAVIEARSEQCDGTNLGGKTCRSLGYDTGTLKCYHNCTLDKRDCRSCGDGIITGAEQCDGSNLGGQTCKSLGFERGTLKCRSNSCQFDTWACIPYGCGNGTLNPKEQCDGTNLAGKSCTSLGYFKGTLACHPNCKLNTNECTSCGNKKADFGEPCDGADLGGKTCLSVNFDYGTLACNKNCTLNTSGCQKCKCGDGIVGGPGTEECDGTNLDGKTCVSEGYDGGTLACGPSCLFDTSGCHRCGDGKVSGSEQCEWGNMRGQTCQSLHYYSGALTCGPTCQFDTAGCTNCGNAKKEGAEECDGADLGGQSCKSLGMDAGKLGCNTNCTLNKSGCSFHTCGDGKVSGAEQCEGSDLQGETCKSLGYAGGTLACTPRCLLNKSGCTTCGNGKADSGEACDGSDLGGKTCTSQGYDGGTLGCKKGCALDTSGCTRCGDGTIDAGEQCDGKNLGGKTCKDAGYYAGALSCTPLCKLNTVKCNHCGDGKVVAGEACDGTNLAGQSCKSLGYDAGTLGCTSLCKLDKSGCTNCGNGKADGPLEQCDGADLRNKTCSRLGYFGGTLACKGNCLLNKSGCTNCGNKQLDGGEACDGTFLGGKSCQDLGFDGGVLGCTTSCALDTARCYKSRVVADDSFADFSRGSAAEAGVKLFVSAKGTVSLLDRLDLDGDGHLDMVFANHFNGRSSQINSYVYWGNTAGFSPSNRTELRTLGGAGVSAADLNTDGHLDLVFANHGVHQKVGNSLVHTYAVNSYVYWGTHQGKVAYSAAYRTELPTLGATGALAADLDQDGHLDLVFSNAYDGKSTLVNAYVYWGGATGYAASNRAELPVMGSAGDDPGPRGAVADLDGDGHLDLVFACHSNGTTTQLNSYVYWGNGTKKGFSPQQRLGLPTHGATGATVVDLDGDGYLDLVFANAGDGTGAATPSYVYWGDGTRSGFSTQKRTSLATVGARGVSAADLNGDQRLDLVFSGRGAAPAYKGEVRVYLGAAGRAFASPPVMLKAMGATENLLADVTGDGVVDLVVANGRQGGSYAVDSFLYQGLVAGLFSTVPKRLRTVGAAGLLGASDPGAVKDRAPRQVMVSRALDTGLAAPVFEKLTWSGTLPASGKLAFQVRSAPTSAGLSSATWYGPTSTADRYTAKTTALNPVHGGDRYVQYRLWLESTFGSTPVLDRVAISYH